MLQLRVFAERSVIGQVAEKLGTLPEARHVSVTESVVGRQASVTADVGTRAADSALALIRALGVPPEDVSLLHLDVVAPGAAADEPVTLVWADLLGQAELNARTAVRYLVFMSVAGVIAGFGVIDRDTILIVGAMAVAPDLLPVTAACTGIVLRRGRLVGRGLEALAAGLVVAGVVAGAVTALLKLCHALPDDFVLKQVDFAAQQHVSAETILVAFAAGLAGMLAVETRASAGVGVAISVTTIPAAAFIGVSAGAGALSRTEGALAVLGANIAMMLVGGSLALAVQRMLGRSAISS